MPNIMQLHNYTHNAIQEGEDQEAIQIAAELDAWNNKVCRKERERCERCAIGV